MNNPRIIPFLGLTVIIAAFATLAPADVVECGETGNKKQLVPGQHADVYNYVGTASEAMYQARLLLTGDTCQECEVVNECTPFPNWSPLSSIDSYFYAVPHTTPAEHNGHAVVLKASETWLSCSKCD